MKEYSGSKSLTLRLFAFSQRHPLLIIALTVLITAFLGYYATQVEIRSEIEDIIPEDEEMTQLINDFLDASQLDEERIRSEMEPTCLAEVARQALEVVAARAKERGVILRSDIPSGLPLIQGSPKRVRRLLVNLLDNGIKFTPEDGEVTLALFDDLDCVRVEVMDTGVGIPPGHLPHIFEDYFRVRRREFIPGAGIGLSTARRIVEAHGGQIWVQSPCRADQTGSKFICSLLKAPSQLAGRGQPSEPAEGVTEGSGYHD